MNERILTKVKRKSKRIFDTLKLSKLFNTQDQNARKSQEIRQTFNTLLYWKNEANILHNRRQFQN